MLNWNRKETEMDAVKVYENNAGGIIYILDRGESRVGYDLGYGLPDGTGLKDLSSHLDDWLPEHTELSNDELLKVLEDGHAYKLIAMRRSDGVILLDTHRMGFAARYYFGLAV